jgi:phosphatidylglycerol:prolipoprotein diacylglycerol transferase
MALGIGLGRIGCFLNGCCFGLPSKVPWAITFPPGSYSNFVFPNESLHPSQLYLAAAGIGLFILLLVMDRKPRFDGWLFWSYIAFDATLRFLIDFTRYYDATSYLGKVGPLAFNVNQVFSVVLILASIVMIRRLRHAPAATPVSPSEATDYQASPAQHDPAR